MWLHVRNIKTPQLSKKLAWLHAKYEVTAVPDALTVELVKRAGSDPYPSQTRDDAQNPPVADEINEPEYEVESILRARTVQRGRGTYRQALVKWVGWKEPTWEPIDNVMDTKALDLFERN